VGVGMKMKIDIRSAIIGALFLLLILNILGLTPLYDTDDIYSKLDDIEYSMSNIESIVNDIEDNIGDDYDYGTVLYKLREIESFLYLCLVQSCFAGYFCHGEVSLLVRFF